MKHKVNIRKEIKIGLLLVAISALIAFAERNQGGIVCKGILVELVNVRDNHFMDEADITKQLESRGESLKGTPMGRINLTALEDVIKHDKHVKDAELYSDLKGNLIVRVELRRPVARIVRNDAPDAYISEEGIVMDVSEKFTSRVMIVSGPYATQLVAMVDLTKSEEGMKLLSMARFIRDHYFWQAQVAQLDINSKGEITIYPQVTGQLVDFGTAQNFEDKFSKLMVFYKEILPRKGWTKYERVNLKYDGQVIAH